MKKAILFFSLILLGFNLSAQEFFSATAATADEAAHLRFMKDNNSEYEKRSAIWKVPSTVVRVIASAQSGAGYLDDHNYGAVLPAAGITKYAKFSATDDFDLVACSKPSRGIEAIALALSIMNSNTGGALQTDEDFLQHVFGAGGELALMASEAELAYKAYTNKEIYLESGYTAPSNGSSYSNSSPVHTASPIVKEEELIEVAPTISTYSNVEVNETTSLPAVPNLMVTEKVKEQLDETITRDEGVQTFQPSESFEAAPITTEASESFESGSYTSETSESFDTAPVATEIVEEDQIENVFIDNDKEEELDAMGRRIIKDPADNINAIETYNTGAAGSKVVRKIEVEEETKESNVASQELDQSVVADQEADVNKRLEATSKQQTELKMAAQTEAQRREAEILKAEQMIIQQRKEMAERRARKAAEAEAEKANGGGN